MKNLKLPKRWPVLLLCLPAFVAIWGGWVGLGAMTGFGVINLLPGMVRDGGWATVNTAVTLPIGLETYAAYALHAALNTTRKGTLRTFAIWSGVASLVLGGSGQLAYHVMESFGVVTAPWWITAIVATIPVAVLGAGAALAALMNREEKELEGEAGAADVDTALANLSALHAEQSEARERELAEQMAAEQEPLPELTLELKPGTAELEQPARPERKAPRIVTAPRPGGAPKPEQAELVKQLMAGETPTADVSPATARLYAKLVRTLADNPQAEFPGGKLDGRSVNATLLSQVREWAQTERGYAL